MMKNKLLSILAAAAAVLVTAACNKEVDPEGSFQELSIQPDALAIDAEGVDGSISFDAPDYWFASCPDKWITLEPYSGKPGKVTLDFKVAKNTTSSERSAVITVNAKTHKGTITVTQSAWPYTDGWSLVGTVDGGSWDQDFFMEDQGNELVWKAGNVRYHTGEAFKFRMGGSDATSLGIAGSLSSSADGFVGNLVKGGESITLPSDGYWDITLDLVAMTVNASFVEKFSWAIVGTIAGGNWEQDLAMTDKEDRMVWEAADILFHPGEEFKFRMDADDNYIYGIDGELTEEGEGFVGALKQGGESLTLPTEGYWTITLDVNSMTVSAVYLRPFTPDPPVIPYKWASVWENDNIHQSVSWDSYYRFAGQGFETGEEVYIVPADEWAKMKSKTFYLLLYGESPSIRVTTGWWTMNLTAADIQPGHELLTDMGNGYWALQLNLAEVPDFIAYLDQQHLLFTGGGFTPYGIYYDKEEWRDNPIVKNVVWTNDDPVGNGPVAWNATYRFACEGFGSGEEIAVIPADTWNKMKTTPFYMSYSAVDSYMIRVITGWWTVQWLGKDNDIAPWNMAERIINNDDGTFSILVDFSEDPAILDVLDEQHLLFTGDAYTPLEIYFLEEGEGGNDSAEIDIAPFTYYEDRSATMTYPYYPSWGDNTGKLRIMRGGNPAIETLGLTTSSKFVVYKEVGSTGQIQWNDPNWGSFSGIECNDWDGSAETIEVPITEDMLKCINGEVTDGWSDTAIILQGDGLTVTKIVIVK